MVKQPTAEQTEFQMSSEDFPALPGTQLTDGLMSSSGSQQMGMNHNLGGNTSSSVGGGGGGMGGIAGSGLDCGSNSLDNKVHHLGSSGTGDMHNDSVSAQDKPFKRGIQTSPDGNFHILIGSRNRAKRSSNKFYFLSLKIGTGMVTNIPASMVNNQFGMVGLLTFIRAAESNPNLVTLAMGQDLTGLGLNLNSQENLYPTFGGPFSDQPCR